MATKPGEPARYVDLEVVPLRRPWLIVASIVVVLAIVASIQSMAVNPNFRWRVVGQYLFDPAVLRGVATTLWLTAVSLTIGIVIGVGVAIMRLSDSALLRSAAATYIGLFRGIPLMVQLLFWYNIAALYPTISLGIPFGPQLWVGSANDIVTPISAAILGLSLNEGAYMAEIVRGAMLGIDRGQTEAAQSLGMRTRQIIGRIILPQAMRIIIPPTGNQVISMLKATSLVSVLSMSELLYTVQVIYSRTFQPIPLLIVACAWYLAIVTILAYLQRVLEKRFGRGYVRRTETKTADEGAGESPENRADPAGKGKAPLSRTRASDGTVVVQVDQVWKRFGSTEVLKGVDLKVGAGQVVCLLGASGSGKTTLLRCVNHLERVDAGRLCVSGSLIGYREKQGRLYELDEREVARQRAGIGMVFQHFNLFPHMTVLENIVEAPMHVKGEKRDQAARRALDLLERVGLRAKAQSYPAELSGGQQQRVAIARALAMNPTLMLFDEPTSALDPELVGEVMAVIRDLAALGMTMVIVTHEIAFAREIADEVVFMHRGVVVERGPARDVLTNPMRPETKSFLARTLSGHATPA